MIQQVIEMEDWNSVTSKANTDESHSPTSKRKLTKSQMKCQNADVCISKRQGIFCSFSWTNF